MAGKRKGPPSKGPPGNGPGEGTDAPENPPAQPRTPTRTIDPRHPLPGPMRRRMLSLKEVLRVVPFSRASLYRKEAEKTFPARVRIGLRRVYWYEDEVFDWLRRPTN